MQTIWITGGSSGIGFAVAQKFLEENWRVIISSRNEDKLKLAVDNLKNITNKKEIYYKTLEKHTRHLNLLIIIWEFL